MAPLTRARARQAAGPSLNNASINDLPDELLVRCLGLLHLKERQQAALVSRRFAAAASSPNLLRDVEVHLFGPPPAARSLLAWLVRHAQHMQRLSLWCDHARTADFNAAARITACLSAIGAAGQLVELEVGSPLTTEWLPAMPSLRRLHLSAWWQHGVSPLLLSPAISSLTALESLQLEGSGISFEAGARLPPALTRLVLSSYRSTEMSEQVAQLPQLARLELHMTDMAADSMAQLSRLAGSLTWLDVTRQDVPAALPALTRLQHLCLWACGSEHDPSGAIHAALPQLAQLTCLVFCVNEIALPAALPELAHLQRCYLHELAADTLRPGPWLAGLRWLVAGLSSLLSSAAVLQAAPALEFVEVLADGVAVDWESPATAALFGWLAAQPPLRRACFSVRNGMPDVYESPHFAARLEQLRQARPSLLLHCTSPGLEGTEEFCFIDSLLAEERS